MIDNLSTRLLELEFKKNQSIKSKCLKSVVQKILPTIWNMLTYYLKKDNDGSTKVPMTVKNKLLIGKSRCAMC